MTCRCQPGGEWSVTADPEISIDTGKAAIRCSTEGASIAYRVGKNLSADVAGHWNLYVNPVEVSAGDTIQCKACRLGFKDSTIVRRANQ